MLTELEIMNTKSLTTQLLYYYRLECNIPGL